MQGVPFSAYWLKALQQGRAAKLEEYSLQAQAARLGRFMRPIRGGRQDSRIMPPATGAC